MGLAAIAIHGLALLGDGWLRPGLAGIAVPLELSYKPYFTAAGIIAGYLALLLGPSFYLRRRIGARRWRKLHRATLVVWVLAAAHTLGSGSDTGTLWLRLIVLAPIPLLAYLLAVRVLGGRPAAGAASTRHRTRRTAPVAGATAVELAPETRPLIRLIRPS
jgi:sulfoxide reductase heme-binding subunit YedZ